MSCPKCGVIVHIDKQSVEISSGCNSAMWGATPEGFLRCWGCGLLRPVLWWEALELDVNTEIKLPEPSKVEEIPEELAGTREAPFGD